MDSLTMTLEFPRDLLDAARLTAGELKLEIAVHLYALGRLSLGKARELAGLSLWEFRQILGARNIDAHLEPEDLRREVQTLRDLGKL